MSKTKDSRWLPAAMMAPVTQAASSCSWVAVLMIGLVCFVIIYGMQKLELDTQKTRLLAGVQWLWMLLIVSEFLHWIMLCWPAEGNPKVIPLTILLVAAYALGKGRKKAAAVAAVLMGILIVLLGAVLISGTKEIKLENLQPQWKMQTAYYVVAMLIPAMALKMAKESKWMLAYGTAVSAITSGVLSVGYLVNCNAPFYEMSKAVSILGVGQRLESLVAAGMTIGYFVLITLLLQITADAWEQGKPKRPGVWLSSAFIGMVFLSGMRMNSRLLALGTLAIWVLLPVVEKIPKIMKKPLDK